MKKFTKRKPNMKIKKKENFEYYVKKRNII